MARASPDARWMNIVRFGLASATWLGASWALFAGHLHGAELGCFAGLAMMLRACIQSGGR
jgi:hypothetical protein